MDFDFSNVISGALGAGGMIPIAVVIMKAYVGSLLAEVRDLRSEVKTLRHEKVGNLEIRIERIESRHEDSAVEARELRTVLEQNNRLINRAETTLSAVNERLARTETLVGIQEKRGDSLSEKLTRHAENVHAHCKVTPGGNHHDCKA